MTITSATILAVSRLADGAMLSLSDKREYFAKASMLTAHYPEPGDFLATAKYGGDYIVAKGAAEEQKADGVYMPTFSLDSPSEPEPAQEPSVPTN
jgi:hypothetical protein